VTVDPLHSRCVFRRLRRMSGEVRVLLRIRSTSVRGAEHGVTGSRIWHVAGVAKTIPHAAVEDHWIHVAGSAGPQTRPRRVQMMKG
jgi:hypothetical protein